MKNFTKTLAAVAIVILASGTESTFANSLTSDAAELKTNEVLGQVSSKGNINIIPWKDIRMEKTTDDIAISMPHYIVDKSFDVEIHETEASDKAWHNIHFFDNVFIK